MHHNGTLYQCSFFGLWVQCLDMEEAKQVMEEAHSGVCSAHQGLNFIIASKGWDIIGLPWCKTA